MPDNGLVQLITCRRCGMQKEPSSRDKHLCVECAKAENSRVTYYRQHQEDWVAAAKEQGIDLWLQQPGETQWEYTVWVKYRDSYPGKKPSYRSVAEELGITYNVVSKIAQRWSFPMRMQAWMVECDRITMLQRRDEILNMNKEHVDMAAMLREKLKTSIEAIDPVALKPGEIASLAKLATEMERKARIDTVAQEEARQPLLVDTGNPNLKKNETKKDDLKEVMDILLKAGALGDITHIGVRHTETTEVALVDKDGQSSSIVMEED